MRRAIPLAFALLFPLSLSAAPAADKAPPPTAKAVLTAKSGSKVSGTIEFIQRKNAVVVEAEVSGLEPGAKHGFHVHEKGDCSAADASSAGGHFNPTAKAHGLPNAAEHHAGDLGNLAANKKGNANAKLKESDLKLEDLIGKSVVIHQAADDGKTQPTGNSGARIACGVIQKAEGAAKAKS